ncbi:MAG TPA: bifunctional serine/threonine-protein kinase/formylglycine-generating enzyme family protein [Terriglobales bacterium]|nr:bifunctional serine/threonine-protein kinase/formylglycine-generating enzyme family protein [Terriglobales bacterium]
MSTAVGTFLGPYQIKSLLGVGGMGEVYCAYDTRLERPVAIKILTAKLLADPDGHARFKQEAKSISALHHPNICVIHDIGSHDGLDFMVMEYLEGKTLDQSIPEGGLPLEFALKYAIQVSEALAHSHAAGIVHRDLKPANVMVDAAGHIKVLDFGLAKLAVPPADPNEAETLATRPGTIVGTLTYMSPEQAEGKPVDARTDVFSFGTVLYEMLTGSRAFQGGSGAAVLSAVMRDEPQPIHERRRDVPPELIRIVTRCLKKNADARYATGAELTQDLKACSDLLFLESGAMLSPARLAREVKRPRVLVPLLVFIILLAAGSAWLVKRSRDARWARDVAIPQIQQLADEGKLVEAYALAVQAEKSLPNDPTLGKLWPTVSYALSLESVPSGVDVFRRSYADGDAPWQLVGRTPFKNIRVPRGMLTWKFEKAGYVSVLHSTAGLPRHSFAPGEAAIASITLEPVGEEHAGMVRVSPAGGFKTLFIPGFEDMPELELADYWMDQYEVTNREFKAFVNAGGYQKREYWKVPFVRDGKTVSWEDALVQFHDAAGRPGPKDWLQGEFPPGHEHYPVTGISWYEAMAYAQYMGKTLPTIYHWNRAAGPRFAAFIVPASNFGTAGALAVGTKPGMSPWGTFDMAGNVKEWIWTESEPGKRYVLGGAYDEPTYMFIDPDAQSPWLRASNIGFRGVKYVKPDSIPAVAFAAVPSRRRDLAGLKPVPDELFRAYRGLYSYDKSPLNASVEKVGNNEEDWTMEKVSYNAPYGNERHRLSFSAEECQASFPDGRLFPGLQRFAAS